MEAKSQLFLKYFTLFMNLLNDCDAQWRAVAGFFEQLADTHQQLPVPESAAANHDHLRWLA